MGRKTDKKNVIFKKKTLNDIFEDIYETAKDKDRQIKTLIGDLSDKINDIKDAQAAVPLIKDFFDLSIKNDDHVIKMARIAQLLLRDEKGVGLETDADLKSLMEDADKLLEERDKTKPKKLDININLKDPAGKSIEE